mmetsp:Transcript_32860/g.90662  ORF Transcript_32860/g.90662 Transcript_32860/m.90662 type:complete len:224 (+) Transcript_32860:603-1274(+)
MINPANATSQIMCTWLKGLATSSQFTPPVMLLKSVNMDRGRVPQYSLRTPFCTLVTSADRAAASGSSNVFSSMYSPTACVTTNANTYMIIKRSSIAQASDFSVQAMEKISVRSARTKRTMRVTRTIRKSLAIRIIRTIRMPPKWSTKPASPPSTDLKTSNSVSMHEQNTMIVSTTNHFQSRLQRHLPPSAHDRKANSTTKKTLKAWLIAERTIGGVSSFLTTM